MELHQRVGFGSGGMELAHPHLPIAGGGKNTAVFRLVAFAPR